VATYMTLGTRGPITGAKDISTGPNAGNYTVTFDQLVWNITTPFFECYRITLDGQPESSFIMYMDQKRWEVQQVGDFNSWEPLVPMLLIPSTVLLYMFDYAPTTIHQPGIPDNIAPTVTMWLRADMDIPANAATGLGQGIGK